MKTVRLHYHHGEVDIVVDQIVSLRDSVSSERPGASTVTTADGKVHIVTEGRDKILKLCAEGAEG